MADAKEIAQQAKRLLEGIKAAAFEPRSKCKHANASLDWEDGYVRFSCPDCTWNWIAHPEQIEKWNHAVMGYLQ